MANEYAVNHADLVSVADAIRAKSGSNSALIFPDGFVSALQNVQPGGGLNFEIVGGAEQPSNPSENTIWVNTDQPIAGWAINSSEPDEPYEGMVWIETASISNVAINAINANELVVRLVKAQYYHSNNWSLVSAKVYQNGAWLVPSVDTIIYVPGDEAEEITGGWYAADARTFTKAADGLQFMNGYVSTVMKIDLTQFSALEITARCASQNAYSLLGVGDTPTSLVTSVQTGTSQSVMQKYTIPLDDLNGEYYIVMHSSSGSALTYVSKIELKADNAINAAGNKLWGGKMITGSFTLSEDSTSEYVIATADDDVVNGLLNEGETFANIYGKLCMLVMRAGTAEFTAANYPGTMGAALRIITKPYSYSSVRQYWNSSGSSATMGGGTTIDSSKIAVTFQSGCAGSAAFTYNWMVWRHV